jgi:hypothetical protein
VRINLSKTLFVAGVLALVTGCGGNDANTGSTISKLSGTAATGAAMTGTVTAVGANGVTTAATIGAGGVYTLDTNGLTYPVMIKADNGLGKVLFSWAANPNTTANITPLTTMTLVLTSLPDDLVAVFNSWKANAALLSGTALNDAQKIVRANLQSLFTANKISPQTYDFFNTVFLANRTGIDAVLDALNFQFNFDCRRKEEEFCDKTSVATVTLADSGQPIKIHGDTPLIGVGGYVTYRENDNQFEKILLKSNAVFSNYYKTLTITDADIAPFNTGSSTYIDLAVGGNTPGTYQLYPQGWEQLFPYKSPYFVPSGGTVTITSRTGTEETGVTISGTFKATGAIRSISIPYNANAKPLTVVEGKFVNVPVIFPLVLDGGILQLR